MKRETGNPNGLEQDGVARGQTERASREPSLKSTDVQQAWWVLCSAAGALWVLAIAPGLITAGIAKHTMPQSHLAGHQVTSFLWLEENI